MRLPGGPLLLLESFALAEAIAAEWQAAGGAKGGSLQAEDVPLTRIAGTAQEHVTVDPRPTIAALARYGESDLLCYRAEAPSALVARQARLWQPWVDWAWQAHGAALRVAQGVVPMVQPPEAVAALHRALEGLSPYMLAGLGVLVPATGSLVLGLAVAAGELDAAVAGDLSQLDEFFQMEQWGEDRQAVLRHGAVAEDVAAAGRFIDLVRPIAGTGAPR
jgi:chaperone required for assembly of F1-ATPase